LNKALNSWSSTTLFSKVLSYPNKMQETMFILTTTPKQSQMALSTQVKESINQAANNLRDALAFAARSEHPVVISTLTDLLVRIESVESIEDIMRQMDDKSKSFGARPPFFMG
jgi:enamine deaminase RidA (YjgF/YER057c/UK114 family)